MELITRALLFALVVLVSRSTGEEATKRSRIMAVFPVAGHSYMNTYSALTTELAKRGHDVISINPYPVKKLIPNFKQIHVKFIESILNTNVFNVYDTKDMSLTEMLYTSFGMAREVCKKCLEMPEVQQLLHSSERFDLIIFGAFSAECYLGLVHKFQAPFIMFSPHRSPLYLEYMGNPEFYSYVPSPTLPYTDRMTFQERLFNTISGVTARVLGSWIYLPEQDEIMRTYFGQSTPPLAEILKNASLMFVNTHVSFSYPRPNLPNVIEIGGIHLHPPHELPQDLKTFLDGAKDGAIYFNLGSIVRSDKMPQEQRQIFLDVFAQLPQRILWKWESDVLPGQPKNVKVGKWLPQADILAHPNVKVFINHGGLLSSQEALYHGVCVLGIPIMGDQKLNVHRIVTAGRGVRLDLRTMTRENLLEALKKLLEDPRYMENAQRASAILKDQPQTPLERAVFWTEYVIRHKGAHHLRSAAVELWWHQYFLLDVIAVLLLTTLCFGGLCFFLVKATVSIIKSRLRRNGQQKQKQK